MTFVSYALNFEDVLLWRALGHVANGFYIDVGANDPVTHSVTKAFYDAGWHGISIEPLPSCHRALLEQRPRDINLAVAAGSRAGGITLFDVPAVNGWATTDPAIAATLRAKGHEVTESTVPVRTLADICAEHARDEIHFLKIDVEGAEGEVLRGMDFARWRPWVLAIEATLPDSRVPSHEAWEPLTTAARYRFAYFDGLNRYYVAEEHPELLAPLSTQPNVFDAFVSHAHEEARRTAERAAAAAAEAERACRAAEKRLALAIAGADRARADAEAYDGELHLLVMRNSWSWRLTKPLRALSRLVSTATGGRLELQAPPLSNRAPASGARNSRQPFADAANAATPGRERDQPEEVRSLPVSARKVFAELERARRVSPRA